MEKNKNIEIINYIKNIIFDAKEGKENLKGNKENLDLVEVYDTIKSFRLSLEALSKGDLSYKITGRGYLLGILKHLQAALRNLNWQIKAITGGDFTQKIDFLGDFSDAFNSMTKKLETSINDLNETKELFEMIFQTIPDATIITGFDDYSIFTYNKAFLELSGYNNSELKNKKLTDFSIFKDMEQKDRLILELKKYGVLRNVEIELIKKNTNSIMTLHSSRIIIIKGKQYVLSIIKDVSILKKYENKLRKSEELHRLLADNVSDMIWTINLDGELTYISPSVKRLLGFSVKEIMNQNISRTFSDKSFVYINQVLYDANICFDNNKPFKPFRKDIEQISKDGSTIWTDLTISGIYDDQDQFVGLVGVSKDISEKKKMEEEIIKLSITDKLTQIYNRVKLDETLNNELLRSKRNGVPSSIILLDIDKFKLVNDNYGHQVGDSVLVEFANVLKKHIRGIDTLGRWGGEEFLIILPGTNLDGAVNLAEKLRECVSAYHFSVAGHITASFGVAISVNNIETELIFRVDQALYLAKSNGRDRVEVVL